MTRLLATMVLVMLAVPASAQVVPPPSQTVSLSGPRIGVTFLDDGVMEELNLRQISIRPTITQFGWQFEKQFYTSSTSVSALNEWVVLVGGLEQGVVIPSVSWLIGIRSSTGAEIGVGPNVTPAGVALVMAGGITFRTDGFNVPLNVAVVPSRTGTRFSVLTGFSLRKR